MIFSKQHTTAREQICRSVETIKSEVQGNLKTDKGASERFNMDKGCSKV